MYGQGNFAPQYPRGPLAPPQPPFARGPPGHHLQFPQAPPCPPPPAIQHGAPPQPPMHQAPLGPPPPPFQHSLPAPPVQRPPQVPVNISQLYTFNQQGPSYTPPPIVGNNAQHLQQPIPPPPRAFAPQLPPAPPQGQGLYSSPHLPPVGIQHASPLPPPPPPSFTPVTPVPCGRPGNDTVGSVQPPSIPPPPPPPPPSSPPPLPPSPPPPSSPENPIFAAMAPDMENKSCSVSLNAVAVPVQSTNNGSYVDTADAEKVSQRHREAPVDLHSPPPKPEDEVVRNIEVLCQFIANVGPDFENLACTREVGNPKFSFLFGGEPGSNDAIAYQYFQWMKTKCCLERNLRQESQHNDALFSASTVNVLSQAANLDNEGVISPTMSDMDMEDDDDLAYGNSAVNKLNKDVMGEASSGNNEVDMVGEPLPASQSTTKQLIPTGAVSSNISLVEPPLLLEDNSYSPFIEDLSPVSSPSDAVNDGHGLQDSTSVKNSEGPRIILNDRGPFQLIQGYDSDDSGEDDKKETAGNAINIIVPVSATEAVLDSPKGKDLEECSNISPKNMINTDTGSNIHNDSFKSLTMSREDDHYGDSPAKSSSTGNVSDPVASDEVDKRLHNKALSLDPTEDTIEGDWVDVDREVRKFQHEGPQIQENPKLDEFGRLVRECLSDSESDGMQHRVRHGKRARSRSRSQSPQESRWRRSRSPRRNKRSRSPSSSPRRSNLPPNRRPNMYAKRERDQMPECFNFIRGKCFRGASCWFLHRGDVNQQRNRQLQYHERHWDSVEDDIHQAMHSREARSQVNSRRSKDKLVSERISMSVKDDLPIKMNVAGQGEVVQVFKEIHDQNENTLYMEKQDPHSPIISGKEEMALPLSEDTLTEVDNIAIGNPGSSDISLFRPSQSAGLSASISPSKVDQTLVHASQSNPDQAPPSDSDQGRSPVVELPATCGPTDQPADPAVQATEFPASTFSGSDIDSHQPQQKPDGHATVLPNAGAPLTSGDPREEDLSPPVTHNAQPSPAVPPHSPHAPVPSGDLSGNVHPANPTRSTLPPPPRPPLVSSHVPELPGRPFLPTPDYSHLQPLTNTMTPVNDITQAVMRPFAPSELTRSHPLDFHPRPFHSAVSSFPPLHTDELKRSFPLGSHQDQPFPRGEMFSRPVPEGPRIMSDTLQSGSYMHHHSLGHDNTRTRFPDPWAGDFAQGNALPSQSLPLQGASVLAESQPFTGDHMPSKFVQREVFSSVPSSSYSHQRPSYGQQHPPGSFVSGSGTAFPSFQKFPPILSESSLSFHGPDMNLPRSSITTRYNPFASTFEQTPANLKSSSISGQGYEADYHLKYGSSLHDGHGPHVGPGSRIAAMPLDMRSIKGQLLPKSGSYVPGSSLEVLADAQLQFRSDAASGAPYDPLFDSIEQPSTSTTKPNPSYEQHLKTNVVGTMSKLSSISRPIEVEDDNKQKGGLVAESEVDELGEVATDLEAGAVENASPEPLDAKDWSPEIPGEIETDQARPAEKNKKSKDSRSMKHFKIALADFVKEVLKPSWRQGNMSKEAFKTIVKKTVDKVSGSVPRHHIPKTQEKIELYVASSQRKLTKLVMGYVDKYVKM